MSNLLQWRNLYKSHFAKLINNDGEKAKLLEDADDALKDLFAKAECLVHYIYASSNKQLILLDIQGSGYSIQF